MGSGSLEGPSAAVSGLEGTESWGGQGYLGTSSHRLAFRLSCQGEIGIGLSCSDLEVLNVYI